MMKLIIAFLFIIPTLCQAQTVLGKWKTIDDESGEERSIVELYKRQGKVYGKIVKIFTKQGEDPDPSCDKCPKDDSRFNKKLIGMEIIQDMKGSDTELKEGKILDPETGKIYRGKLWVEGDNLQVRGYWGPFFRTQTWKKVH
jgi:uncharacterized protein (DUF2147 family)